MSSARCHADRPSHNMGSRKNKIQCLYKIPNKNEEKESDLFKPWLTYTGPDTPIASWYLKSLTDLIDMVNWTINIKNETDNATNLAIFSVHNRICEVRWLLEAGVAPNAIIYTRSGFVCKYKRDNNRIKQWFKKHYYLPIEQGSADQKAFICKISEYDTVKKFFDKNKKKIKIEFCPKVWREVAPFTAPPATLAVQTAQDNFFILQYAIEHNYIAIANNLIMKGAITNLIYPDGKTLLHVAIKNNNVEMIQILVFYSRILLNLEDSTGQRALDCALMEGYNKNKQAVEFLYKHGARFSKNISKQESKRVTNFRQRCIEKNIQKSCANCDKESTTADKLKQCSSCKCVYYCSKHCQKVHWKKIHFKDCKFTCTHCKRVFPPWGKTSVHYSLINSKRPCCSRKKCMKKDLFLSSDQANSENNEHDHTDCLRLTQRPIFI